VQPAIKYRKPFVDFNRGIAQKIKTSSDYNHQVGEEFNIIGAESSFDKDTFKTVTPAHADMLSVCQQYPLFGRSPKLIPTNNNSAI